MTKLRVIHVVSSVESQVSGPTHSVASLAKHQKSNNIYPWIISLSHHTSLDQLNIKFKRHSFLFKFGLSWSMFIFCATKLKNKPHRRIVVHNHGLWMFPNLIFYFFCSLRSIRYIHSPRGTLSAWAFNSGSPFKKMIWPLQKRVLMGADCLHATSKLEESDLHQLNTHIYVAENFLLENPSLSSKNRRFAVAKKTVLFLSRIHPKKRYDILLDAWKYFDNRTDAQLVLCGSGEQKYVDDLNNLLTDGNFRNAKYIGPVNGNDKWKILYNAHVLFLPSESENFGMVVLEALSVGLPVVTTVNTPWQDLEAFGAGYCDQLDLSIVIKRLDYFLNLTEKKHAVYREKALLLADKFSPAMQVEKHLSAYGRIGQ